jgi:hypothetical protein
MEKPSLRVTKEHARQGAAGFVMMEKRGARYELCGVPADMVPQYLAWGWQVAQPKE